MVGLTPANKSEKIDFNESVKMADTHHSLASRYSYTSSGGPCNSRVDSTITRDNRVDSTIVLYWLHFWQEWSALQLVAVQAIIWL